ncbi:MAG TPA: ABC transporter ATP-binding protein [Acidobacteriaceae bacterium]|nr:ABC transporter ATP-binding protein [Acidobacteriaceae bacterium]
MRFGSMPVNAERGGSRAIRARAGAEMAKKKPELRKVMPEIWKLVRPRRWLLVLGLALVAINRVAGLVLPYLSKPFVSLVLTKHDENRLMPLVIAVFLATLIQAVTSFSNTQLLSKAAQRMIAELRQQVQQHVGRLSVSFYDANRTGLLVSRIMSDVEGIRNLVGTGLVEFVGGLMTAVMAFVFLLHRSPRMTLIVFAVVGAFVFILQKAFKTIRPIFRERAKISGEVTGRLTESLGGVRVVKGYHAEVREAGVFSVGVLRLLENVMRSLTATSLLSMAATTVLGVVGGLVMLLGGHLAMRGQMGPGDYIQYTMFLAFMIAPVIQVVNIGTQLTEAVAGLDRTMEILAEMDEFADPARVVTLDEIVGEVRFDDVRFAYDPQKPVLHGISFESQPGTVTALVGSSGSGKSTIISLICAFHKPDAGRVLVDGIDLSTVRLDSYRSQLGVVLQESFLFDGTIKENVMFSHPEATEEEFLSSCRIARVDEFAERFPEGYDTVVGERGVKLSGGQRQRLSIARAILASPRILILDEATSSLDSESEAMIQHGLSYLMQGRTTFVIAHRLSTIRRADQILVVEGGRIVERGTHASLYALGGRYYDLYTRQHGLEENLFLAPGEGDAVEEETK